MSFNPEELREILSIYKAESDEHLQKLNQCLLGLEKEPEKADILEEVFREAHSLKGSARMIGFGAVEKVAHSLEDLFSAARKGELKLSGDVFDVIFESLDIIASKTESWLADPEMDTGDMSGLISRIEEARQAVAAGKKKARDGRKGAADPDQARPGPPSDRKTSVSEELPAGEPGRSRPQEKPDVDEDRAEAAVAEAVTTAAPPKIELEETIRVTTEKLDNLMSQIGEILVTKIKFDQRLNEVRQLELEVGELHRDWLNTLRQMELQSFSSGNGDGGPPVEDYKAAVGRLGALQDGFGSFVTRFNEDSLRMTLISSELQESINRVRMMPLSSLFNLFPRLLRDVIRGEGKEAELDITGGGIQLDKRIIEQLKDPLMHLLRNAIDHGLESPGERVEAGKDPAGIIRLAAQQKASSVLIEVSDDGAGLDMDKIRSIALKRGVVTEEQLAEMPESQVMGLVFRPGFSTKDIITDLSGRGVGLDVVFNHIERMKGSISLESAPGRGSAFAIKLPVSLATSQALLVRVGGQVFTIPLTAVETIVEIGLKDVMTVESREALFVAGVPTALVRLHELLGMEESDFHLTDDEKIPVVVVGSAEERVALMVSEVIGEKEIVVKGLGSQLRRVRNISGATILGDGSVVLILNVFDLIKSSQKVRGLWVAQDRQKAEEEGRKPEILVADDSVTTRVLEKNILESSGYSVTLAVDGADALQKARNGDFDLVVSDVEMPRMSGFELTRALRKEKRFQDLPIILVTSLDSEEDKREGIESGADAYITKGNFEQGNLISAVRQLL